MNAPSMAATCHLDIAYHAVGSAGEPLLLLHGFPYSPDAYTVAASLFAERGYRVIVPYLRGFGPTRFRDPATLRSGQQAALGHDVVALLDALDLDRAILVGYDWGGRAACVTAALRPDRVRALVTIGGYNIQDIPGSITPAPPAFEHLLWYQYYFHGERGHAGLTADRRAFCRYLWQCWSPGWAFDDATFERSAQAFDNPDFIDVVIHSYRHRFGLVLGDPHFDEDEAHLARQPDITVPALVIAPLHGLQPVAMVTAGARRFTDLRGVEQWPGIGHNAPQEGPERLVAAITRLRTGLP